MSVEEYTRAINRWSVRKEPGRWGGRAGKEGGREHNHIEKNKIGHYGPIEKDLCV